MSISAKDIKTGHAYRAANGQAWLCLHGIEYDVTWGLPGRDGSSKACSTRHAGHDAYQNLKWTTTLTQEAAARGVRSFEDLVRMMTEVLPDSPWHLSLSNRQTPMRYAEDLGPVFDPAVPPKSISVTYATHGATFRYRFRPYDPSMPRKRLKAKTWNGDPIELVPAWKPVQCRTCGETVHRGQYWNGSSIFPRCQHCTECPPKAKTR